METPLADRHPPLTAAPSPAPGEAASALARAATAALPGDPDEVTLVIRATGLLHAYGTPAHRLERVVVNLAESRGLSVEVFSTPTSILLGFGAEVEDRVRLLRVEPGGVDLGRLEDLDELLDEVSAGALAPAVALERLDALDAAAPRWSAPAVLLGHGLAAGGAAAFFGGALPDALLSFALGLVIGVLQRVASRRQGVARIFEPLAAGTAAAAALAAAHLSGGRINDGVVALASIIVLVPGLSLTVALLELATRNLASGTARLAGAATVFLTIGFGALLGRFAVQAALGPGAPPALERAADPWLASAPGLGLTLLFASAGFSLLFRVRPTEMGWVAAACGFGFGTARVTGSLGAGVGSVESAALSAFSGALAVGIFSNAYARLRDRPALVPLVPGLLVLVPGAVGYRALSALAKQDTMAGIETAFQMLLLAAALVGGMLTANAVLPPRRML